MDKPISKYFVAILTSNTALLADILKRLKRRFGDADFISEWYLFSHTNYYGAEMGSNLKRCLVSFKKLLPAYVLPKAKKWAQKIENKFKDNGKRRVNIDVGYMDFCKVVLASHKFGGRRIAITDLCCADMIMGYEKGTWHPMPWCFPDFASGAYNDALSNMRGLFKNTIGTSRTAS